MDDPCGDHDQTAALLRAAERFRLALGAPETLALRLRRGRSGRWRVEFDIPTAGIGSHVASDSVAAENSDPGSKRLRAQILEALGGDTLTGKQIAARCKRSYNAHFGRVLTALRKAKVLGHRTEGFYRRSPADSTSHRKVGSKTPLE
jgi:hypothetical protein